MTLKELLIAFGDKKASMDQVLRALVSYNDWLVDSSLAMHVTGETHFKHAHLLGTPSNVPADRHWFFTDEAAVNIAVGKGAMLGIYAGGVPGTQLFSLLPADYAAVNVNIGSPQNETFFIPQESFSLVALWAHAVTLERRLTEADSPQKFAAMRDYVGYIYFINPEHDAIVTAVGMGGMKNPAMVFTAVDCVHELRAEYPNLHQQIVDGRTLFSMLPKQGVDGIVVNPFGPGINTSFDISVCEKVLSA